MAAKWKRNYRNQTTKEPWYILTNQGSLTVAIQAYKRRMGIEAEGVTRELGGRADNGLRPYTSHIKAAFMGGVTG